MPSFEAACSSAVKAAIDMKAALIAVITNDLVPAQYVAKYKPRMAVLVVTTDPLVARQCSCSYSLHPLLVTELTTMEATVPHIVAYARACHIGDLVVGDSKGDQIVVVHGRDELPVDFFPVVETVCVGDESAHLERPVGYWGADTLCYASTKIGMDTICEPLKSLRKTKVLCTMGPKCWSAEGLAALLDAGLNVARFNFSHGEHAAHLEVLDRFRKVCSDKNSFAATLLDTKGPEIRTAMLKDHEAIQLEKGQQVIVRAVGAEYTSWEGYKTDTETKIGLSYDKLCSSVAVGGTILLGDGTISLRVTEIIDDVELRAEVLNTAKLGERKNCNLPGVKVDIPVLTEKDIDDLQNFACKHKMDYVAASFVQSGDDVQLIRRILDEAGGQHIKIISKIENQAGLTNFDEILRYTDGVMVARGDLGMEIPPEKVCLAQKMLITKCNVAGKFVVTATQMLESMITNPRPTRAEMTDVANAVFDGTDAVMLSGETANGSFPSLAVRTMAAIVSNAELGIDYYDQYAMIRYWNTLGNRKTLSPEESVFSCAAKNAIDLAGDTNLDGAIDSSEAGLIIVFSGSGLAANTVSKYRPVSPILVVTASPEVARQTSCVFGQYSLLVDQLDDATVVLAEATEYACSIDLLTDDTAVVLVIGQSAPDADEQPVMKVFRHNGGLAGALLDTPAPPLGEAWHRVGTLTVRAAKISMHHILHPAKESVIRGCKIFCTMGPKCWSEETLGHLLDAGLNVARFNFSHGEHAAHLEVLDRFRKVCSDKNSFAATLLDTKG
eukprot:CAMPEP_0114562686 /NCGR_PEP_ID=MMETSP0114-20121206/12670_1 /TAXON_ID=31324 /ORGANISM="Goniomonas sp, Strain m" /LENGTH=780 /DNA_ID=CAMNT_0001748405 /DNA_START=69 /DNA_END=2407 /DNA_ORIENTATION=+